jgi:thiamine pyrophosphate-dependent acetolactate synthase large subunit-like protein
MVELGGDYVGVAKALGAEAERVEHPAEIRPALRRALEATRGGRAAIVEFMTKQLEPQPRPDRAPGAC